MPQQYTNELTPEILAGFDKSPFTAEQRVEMHADALAVIEEQEAYNSQHPVNAIYRMAVAGSLTERGGVAEEFDPDPNNGLKIRLSSGQFASVLTAGCVVTYADGTTAKIVTSAGNQFTGKDGGVALVGSVLDNGDVITSTPQSSGLLVGREGVPMAADFLAMPGA